MSKKIILCAPMFLNFGGGISVFSRELALALKNDSGNSKQLKLFSKLDFRGSFDQFTVTGFGALPKPFQSLMLGAALFYSAIIWRPNIIVSTHLNFGPVLYWINRFLKIPYILVAHGIEVNNTLSASRLKALHRADSVWAVSRWTKSQLVNIGISSESICIIPNTVSSTKFGIAPKNHKLLERYKIQSDEMILLTVARLDPREAYKGYDRIIYALSLLPKTLKVRFLIAGGGSDGDRILSIASNLGVSSLITLCGFVPDEELADHYRLADAFALPSKGEGFGIVFLEAMACGVPVMGGNEDGSTDALLNGMLGLLINPNDIEEIANGLTSLLQKRGPELWFSPNNLRNACLNNYGKEVFRHKVRAALAL